MTALGDQAPTRSVAAPRRACASWVATVAFAASGVALAVTLFVRWIGDGIGSRLTGRELAVALRSWEGDWSRWGAVASAVIHLGAIFGFLLIASCWSRARPLRIARWMLIVGLAVTLVGMVVSGLLPIDRWGPAVVLLVVADALGLVGLVSETLEGN
jgi:hypothetical protein